MIFMNLPRAAAKRWRTPHNGAMSPAATTPSAAPPEALGLGLRVKLNLLVATLMLAFAASLLCLQLEATRASVREEIVAANRVATQLLERVSWIVARGGPRAMLSFLDQLGRLRSNEITLVDEDGRQLYRSPPPAYKQGRSAPAWFSALVVPAVQRHVIPLQGARMTIEADPSRAILDGWDDLSRLIWVALAALVLINVAVTLAMGQMLRPFARIVEALRRLQLGDYAHRLPALPGREAALMGDAVNRLGEAINTGLRQRMQAFETESHLAASRDWSQRLEQERREIAAELHDELGQSVTAIRALAKSLQPRLSAADRQGQEALHLIDTEAARLYDAMQGMIPRLAPLDLGPQGLPEALADLVAALRQRHPQLRIELQLAGAGQDLSPQLTLAAYRVAQEACNNAIKHSGCRSLHVSLQGGPPLLLTVDDDGCGLPPPEARPQRFGLSGLRERVAALGGEFEAAARSEGGTRVWARLPGTIEKENA